MKRYQVTDLETGTVNEWETKDKMLLGVHYLNKRLLHGVEVYDRQEHKYAYLNPSEAKSE